MNDWERRVARRIDLTLDGHLERREGDEMACSCGKRWPNGEEHP